MGFYHQLKLTSICTFFCKRQLYFIIYKTKNEKSRQKKKITVFENDKAEKDIGKSNKKRCEFADPNDNRKVVHLRRVLKTKKKKKKNERIDK